ncbi:MAG: hypothetical protein PHT02_14640 [Tissierellia bacterium]|nr:hypothetical protein [Tissierellia bacterium]
MTKFKIGDKFIPRMPNTYDIVKLRRYWNCTYTVRAINNEWVIARENGLIFHVDWCEKVEEHISAVGKTIDWEQRRYEIAKDFMTAQINSLYSSLKSKGKEWSYIDEARYAVNAADILIKQLQKSLEK